MNENQIAIDTLIKYVNSMIDNKFSVVPSDATVKMKIAGILGQNQYSVEIYGEEKTASALNNISYSIGDFVWVLIPKGDWSTLLIIGK